MPIRRPLDNTCRDLDCESIDHSGAGCFQTDLHEDMEWRPIAVLQRLYPELVFSRVAGKNRPKGYAYVKRAAKGWTCARWRTAEDAP